MWPPHSPDLNTCDFYLWGHLKSMVNNPWMISKTLDDLKANIEREIKKISKLKKSIIIFHYKCE